MFLITSGAYIDQEFVSEIGKLPPSFLPLGNRYLFEYQISLAKQKSEDIYLSIPASFELSNLEKELLKTHKVQLVYIPEGLSLSESISYSIKQSDNLDESLHILHGDTLFLELPAGRDLLTISRNMGYYERAILSDETYTELLNTSQAVEDELVVSGYFSFSNQKIFSRLLEENQFITAINKYHDQNHLITVEVKDWFDFGHINAYFNSRAAYTTERNFNTLQISPSIVKKTSLMDFKMKGEANWFAQLPASLQIYTPKLIEVDSNSDCDINSSGYVIEYLYNLPLSDLLVFGRLKKETWRSIFRSCQDFLDLCIKTNFSQFDSLDSTSIYHQLYLSKTIQRLDEFANATGIDLNQTLTLNGHIYPSAFSIAEESSKFIRATNDADISIVHGDFCFSNILYDFRTKRIKVIDPRGIDYEGNPSMLGDRRYDLAKLYHSVHGLYDFIIAGHLCASGDFYDLQFLDKSINNHLDNLEVFHEVFFANQPHVLKEIHAITIHLFLSMLPLHNDYPDRQKTMLANAIRLYDELIREK